MNNTHQTMALTCAKTNGMKIRGRISFKSSASGATVVPLALLLLPGREGGIKKKQLSTK